MTSGTFELADERKALARLFSLDARRDKKRVLPCAAYLNGEYGVKDMYVGVPVVIGSKGVERIVEIELAGKDREGFDKSVGAVQGLVDACKKIAPDLLGK